jgi:hypothetical protein
MSDDILNEGEILEVPSNEAPRSLNDIDAVTKSVILAAILQLRVMGVRYEKIAGIVNEKYNMNINRAAAHRLYTSYLKDMPKETLEESRHLALIRINEIMQLAFRKAQKGSAKHLEIALAANKQHIELLGLDAPQEIVINANERAEEVRQRLIERAAELTAARDNNLIN